MDIKRAKEIINSSNNIEVLYNGDLVWLENVKGDSMKIEVMNLDKNKRMSVSLDELKETGEIEPFTIS